MIRSRYSSVNSSTRNVLHGLDGEPGIGLVRPHLGSHGRRKALCLRCAAIRAIVAKGEVCGAGSITICLPATTPRRGGDLSAFTRLAGLEDYVVQARLVHDAHLVVAIISLGPYPCSTVVSLVKAGFCVINPQFQNFAHVLQHKPGVSAALGNGRKGSLCFGGVCPWCGYTKRGSKAPLLYFSSVCQICAGDSCSPAIMERNKPLSWELSGRGNNPLRLFIGSWLCHCLAGLKAAYTPV